MADRNGIRPVKYWVRTQHFVLLCMLVVTTWLELCMSDSSSCHHHLHHI